MLILGTNYNSDIVLQYSFNTENPVLVVIVNNNGMPSTADLLLLMVEIQQHRFYL